MVPEGARTVSWAAPHLTLSMEVSFLSALVACPGSGAPSGGELPEHSNKVVVFFILTSLFT
jgi:hypothetical protein